MQSRCKGGICGHSVSAFGNSVSMPIAALGLSGHCNGYQATVAVICNRKGPNYTRARLLGFKMSVRPLIASGPQFHLQVWDANLDPFQGWFRTVFGAYVGILYDTLRPW